MQSRLLLVAVAALAAGCSIGPSAENEPRTRPETADQFIEYIRQDIETHDWQSILSSSDPELYQRRVVQADVPEERYVAELLGLLREGNTIQDGDSLDWEDLNRIEFVTLAAQGDQQAPYRFSGQVSLLEGGSLRIDARVTEVQGRFVLTSPQL